jgi:predicted MPP superfamily phosphohydrolase
MDHSKFILFFLMIAAILTTADIYFYFGIKSRLSKKWKIVYLTVSAISFAFIMFGSYNYFTGQKSSIFVRTYLWGSFMFVYLSKLIGCLWIIADDLRRLFIWTKAKVTADKETTKDGITRKKFLQMGALGTFGVFASTFFYGMLRGGYNYTIHYVDLKLKNLPKNFQGLKIVQISDQHVGSFLSSDPLEEAYAMINELKPDVIFFTGDLVNDVTEEALPHAETFKKLKAKYGVFSILGNHDYGDYFYQPDSPDYEKNKAHNRALMQKVHKDAGWDLLLNENRTIEIDGEKISIIGVENWGDGRFAKYGDIAKAYEGVDKDSVQLLLSHDPSHWDAQIIKDYPNIDCTFSGHTHGMQFGIETKYFKFSPVQWRYTQWAGLYEKGAQQIYVNRGLGFVGYPGRVGISPEISLITLSRA